MTESDADGSASDEKALTDGDYHSLAQFRQALRAFLHFSERAARDAGLTPAQHQLLLAARGYDGDGLPPLAHLADVLKLKLHSTGELVDRAEANGLVHKRDDPLDRRRVMVELTDEGRAHLDALTKLHRHELRRFSAEMRAILSELDD